MERVNLSGSEQDTLSKLIHEPQRETMDAKASSPGLPAQPPGAQVVALFHWSLVTIFYAEAIFCIYVIIVIIIITTYIYI